MIEQNKSAKLGIEYSKLKSELCEVKRQYKEKTELETYTEQTQNQIILNYFMAYWVYLSDYLPLDIGTMTAYLSTGANQFALKILKLFI